MGIALARERTSLVTGGVLVVLALAAWVAVVLQAAAPMPASGAAEMVVFLGAWGIMRAAMVLPSATPMIALHGALRRNATGARSTGAAAVLFALVYLAVWVAFGVPVYVASGIIGAQTGLTDVLPHALVIVLVATGVYQLTPLKRACLRVRTLWGLTGTTPAATTTGTSLRSTGRDSATAGRARVAAGGRLPEPVGGHSRSVYSDVRLTHRSTYPGRRRNRSATTSFDPGRWVPLDHRVSTVIVTD